MEHDEHSDRQRRLMVWLLVAGPPFLMTGLSVALSIPAFFFIAFLWALGATIISLAYRPKPQVAAPPPAPALPYRPASSSGTAEISSAIVRVASVKAEYGALLGDIAYRIENSALFDDAAPLTREFQLALMRWDDVQNTADPVTLQRVSAEVDLAFRTAKSNAETLGLSHLPHTAQAKAERALKSAQLAERAATDSEREAAMVQVTRLLDSIAIYYLPSPAEAARMLGEKRPELG
ncbi:MAG: hypothetical protein Q4G35_13890 [Propionibacteriaceae bacterium]|nr:hypothetical protein [Propionibacteriaceae bacterium]